MRKNEFKFLPALLFFTFCLTNLKADVSYSIPLKGKEHQIGSLLNWSTHVEENSEVFFVEKSKDGESYQIIGEVTAAGNSENEMSYRFLDVGINDGEAYYRLRQVDLDGTSSFSQTIKLQKKLDNNFMVLSISNIETDSKLSVMLDSNIDGELQYFVKNRFGDLVQANKTELYFGVNDIMIDFENELPGTYFITFKVGKEKEQIVIRTIEDEIRKKDNVASKESNSNG